jgi:hypothetical protein
MWFETDTGELVNLGNLASIKRVDGRDGSYLVGFGQIFETEEGPQSDGYELCSPLPREQADALRKRIAKLLNAKTAQMLSSTVGSL